jgi:hypothetical protein
MFQLERAGWGDLSGADLRGVRITLSVLSRILPDKSAEGLATAEQIAAATGYSVRWTRRCLQGLEEIGVLTWRRGGIANGKPQPSWFRIEKKVLVALIGIARKVRDEMTALLRARTAARIRGLRVFYLRSRTHKRRSVHAELTASLPPYGEVSPPPPRHDAPSADAAGYVAAARAAIEEARRSR